ncbi:MAG TPA: hypothetical protein VJ521_08895 [Acidobacteriota bacterium]|nr:hypothetical protein [Acidobacteriota bacterium]
MQGEFCNPFQRIQDLTVGLKERITPVIGNGALCEVFEQSTIGQGKPGCGGRSIIPDIVTDQT